MNDKLLNVILFTTGAVIGSLVTWKVVKTKYDCIAQEEINSVKEEYASLMQKMKEKLKESAIYEDSNDSDSYKDESDEFDEFDEFDESEMTKYHNIIKKYNGISDDENDEEGGNRDSDDGEAPYINGPYVISPDEFSSSPPGYDAQPLDYYADGILADGWGVELDIEETIGEEALDHFGEYADDTVYVRNERNEIDYEVTKDPRTYEEAIRTNPYYGQ